MKFYTIGYGGRKPQDFIDLLKKHGIKAVVDVRLRPDKASMGIYVKAKDNNKGIKNLLTNSGIEYFSFIELGNIFIDSDAWRQKYRSLLNSAGKLLIQRLSGLPQPFCLMCTEKHVTECHRELIADYLVAQGN